RRGDGSVIAHDLVRDLPRHLRPGDLLVLNSTRVLPARFRGIREDSGGKVDGLYLGPAAGDSRGWIVLLKSRRAKPGVLIRLHDRQANPTDLRLRLVERSHE